MDGKRENTIVENIKFRRSVRGFKGTNVPKELVEKILEAGRFAPSALNMQPWKFVIISDKKKIEELGHIATANLKKLYKLIPLLKIFIKNYRDARVVNAIKKTALNEGDTVFYNAPLLILIANDKRINDSRANCFLAAQNMMLAAHSLGIGSCFIGRGRAIPKNLLLEICGLPKFYDVNIHLAFGYSNQGQRALPARKQDAIIWA